MTPETPPPSESEPQHPEREPPFGAEAAASTERALAHLKDPDDALRILRGIEENGAAFAAYLLLPDTNLAGPDLLDGFHDSYVDAWKRFAQFRQDVLEGLGWLDAIERS